MGISLPCLSRNMISLPWPSLYVRLTFLRLFDVTIVSRKISWLYFTLSSLAFILMVLHISAYFIRCLSSSFPTIYRRFVIGDRVGDDILDFRGLSIALATLDELWWIMSVMVSLMESNRFLNSSWNSTFFRRFCAASTFGGLLVINLFLSTSTSNLMLLITIVWSLPMLTWLRTVTSVTMSGLFVMDVVNFGLRYTVWAFPCPSPPCFLLEHGIAWLWILGAAGDWSHDLVVVSMLVLLAYPSTLAGADWKEQNIIG